MLGNSKMFSQKKQPFRARRTSFARCFTIDDDDDGSVDSLVTEWDRESSLGVEMDEREGNVWERGVSVVWVGVFIG